MNPLVGVLLRAGTALLLFWALAPHPYWFFDILRVLVTISTAVMASEAWGDFELRDVYGSGILYANPRVWLWCFVGCAVLFNPLLPVRLDRASWMVLDAGAGLLFLASASTVLSRLRTGCKQKAVD